MAKVSKIIFTGLFWCYLLVLLRITVFRSDLSIQNLMQKGTINLTLFQDYLPLLAEGRRFLFLYLFIGNIIWFVPFGFWQLWSGKVKTICRAVCLGFLLSLMIEALQYVLGTGISEADDIILNTLGTWIGAGSCRIMEKFIKGNKEEL